jgi:outer membrane protein TolC
VKTRVWQRETQRYWFLPGLLMGLLLMGAMEAVAASSGQRLTLEQCLERALTYGPDVTEAQTEIRIAESQLAQAKAGRLPLRASMALSMVPQGMPSLVAPTTRIWGLSREAN